MATLTKKQKLFIVESLACMDTPSEVAEAFKEEFGVEVDRRQVANYDGSKPHSRQRMATLLVEHFDTCSEQFRREYEKIPIANKARRLRILDKNERKARGVGNLVLSNATVEQAAKEMGEAYTNKRVLQGDPERPLEIRGVNFAPPNAGDSD